MTNEDVLNDMLRKTFPNKVFIHSVDEQNKTRAIHFTEEWLNAEHKAEVMAKEEGKILEMAKDIINLKLLLIKNSIGRGNCPFAVSPLKVHLDIDCSTADCRDCNDIWAKAKRKEITEEVIAHYGLQKNGNKE